MKPAMTKEGEHDDVFKEVDVEGVLGDDNDNDEDEDRERGCDKEGEVVVIEEVVVEGSVDGLK